MYDNNANANLRVLSSFSFSFTDLGRLLVRLGVRQGDISGLRTVMSVVNKTISPIVIRDTAHIVRLAMGCRVVYRLHFQVHLREHACCSFLVLKSTYSPTTVETYIE